MKNLAKIILPLAFLALPLTSQSQDVPKVQKGPYSKVGFAIGYSHNSAMQEYFKTPLGFEVVLGKEILPELAAEIGINQIFAKEKIETGFDRNMNLWSIGPTVLWTPTFGAADGIYFGGGIKYKRLSERWNNGPNQFGQATNDKSASADGIGISLKFGSEFNLGKKAKLFIEIEYDQAKVEIDTEKTDIGMTKAGIGIRF